LEVVDDGHDLTPARPKQRALLALLVLRANELVATDELLEALWGPEPPETARKALQGHVSALRKALGAHAIETRPPGYALRLRADQTDVGRFHALVEEARGEPDPAARSQLLRCALELFRGEPLADFRYESFAREGAAALDDARLTVVEERIEADLALGRHAEVAAELERLVAANPLRERLRAQLMVALYRGGRQSDALHVYQEARRLLAGELGLDPGPALRHLERQILEHDPALAPPQQRAPEVRPREERKVVTILFCDLVAFTSAAEELDPEDVRALQRSYFDRVRSEIERFGGTIEKFVGDAVMAVFGAPSAHEDDPERAVRAAFAVRDALSTELGLRIGVQTGEVLVTIDADPRSGEGIVAGDVVNTAARLQAMAPTNGILVGEATVRATGAAISYGERRLVTAKGKTAPIVAYEALALGAVPDDLRSFPSFVGRARELDQLVAAFERARAERSLELATIVGVPGIGKTRLLSELRDKLGDEMTWYQGRSLPYGDGVTYWAVGELVKAAVGILESDDAAIAATKIADAAADVVADPAHAAWVSRQLRPLVGGGVDGSPGEGEAATAWRLFFEGLADRGPLVLALEDLHWADTALLDFADELVDRAADVPLLVVCTARPELLDRRPTWGGGKRNSTIVSLAPLSRDDTRRLVSGLLRDEPLAADAEARILDRAEGNPLYAQEYARLVGELGIGEELPTPDSLHALIAARIDGLSPPEKALVQDAAVVGEVLWTDALAAIAGQPVAAVEELVRSLERKDFLRRHRRSSVEEQNEYSFQHVLVRDVAYSQIPRAERARKHEAAAQWIEELGRREDHAELLAHHDVRALELTRAARQPTARLELRARLSLRAAGDRAAALASFRVARSYYERAVDLWPEDDPERPRLLLAVARQAHALVERTDEAGAIARDALLAAGDAAGAAEAEVMIGDFCRSAGRDDERAQHFARARELIEAARPSPSKAHVIERIAMDYVFSGDPAAGLPYAEEAVEMAEAFDLRHLLVDALNARGSTRAGLGDLAGIADLEAAVEAAAALSSLRELMDVYGNLAVWSFEVGELERGYAANRAARELAERMRLERGLSWTMIAVGEDHLFRGEWDAVLATVEAALPVASASVRHTTPLRYLRGLVRLGRGDLAGAEDDARYCLDASLPGSDRAGPPAFAARLALERGRPAEAAAFADEAVAAVVRWNYSGSPPFMLVDLEIVLSALGRGAELLPVLARKNPVAPWYRALRASIDGDLVAAADIYGEIGAGAFEAHARLRAGEALAAAGEGPRAEEQLRRAVDFYPKAGAAAYMARAEAARAAVGVGSRGRR
jgi:DNA-binding SARP family transcriptional activator